VTRGSLALANLGKDELRRRARPSWRGRTGDHRRGPPDHTELRAAADRLRGQAEARGKPQRHASYQHLVRSMSLRFPPSLCLTTEPVCGRSEFSVIGRTEIVQRPTRPRSRTTARRCCCATRTISAESRRTTLASRLLVLVRSMSLRFPPSLCLTTEPVCGRSEFSVIGRNSASIANDRSSMLLRNSHHIRRVPSHHLSLDEPNQGR
jgi:hypothetical protein